LYAHQKVLVVVEDDVLELVEDVVERVEAVDEVEELLVVDVVVL
jgi:hypothetical protein